MKLYSFLLNREVANEKLLIYGASIGGEIILSLLKKQGISVWGVCDRAKYGQEFMGHIVMSPEKALEERDISVLVTATRAFNSIIQFLDNYSNIKVYEISSFIRGQNINFHDISYNKMEIEDYKKKYEYYVNEYQNDEKIVLPTFDVVVSEVCNLLCKDCSALVPYLSNRNIYEAEEIMQDFKKLEGIIDHIIEIVIVGGEPFIYKDLDKLLYFLEEQEYIEEISVVSNGTILPEGDLLKALRLDKVRVRISDYNNKKQKIRELEELFEQNRIHYYIQKLDFWLDMGKPVWRGYCSHELSAIFRDCAFSRSQGLLNGKIFRCMHAAEIFNLTNLPIQEGEDYVEVRNNGKNFAEFKKDLKRYLFDVDSICMCNYCSGAKYNIQPAVQIGHDT